MPSPSPKTTVLPEPVLLSKRQAAHALAISIWTLDELVRAGQLAAKKLGSRVVFDPDEIRRFADNLPAWEPR